MNKPSPIDEFDELASPESVAWTIAGVAIGALVAVVVLPHVVPAIVTSLLGPQPKAWWYLTRASGLVSYALLSLSMVLGLLLSTRFAKTWPGAAAAFSLHEHASVLALAFAIFHAVVLLGDRHTPFALAEIALPFGATYRSIGVGVGQLAVYGTALLVASFYVRKRIGRRAWRALHFTSFVVFALVTSHALAVGTDRQLVIAGVAPAFAILTFLGIYRALAGLAGSAARAREQTAP